MAGKGIEITFPTGRWVNGSIWEGQTKDMSGNPLVYKSGPDAGKPRQNFYFGYAIPKAGEQHWAQTPWGAQIWNYVNSVFPQAQQRPNFAWKIIDGDSQQPNDRGKKPCDQEGHAGHWILRFGGAFAPEVGTLNGGTWRVLTDPNAVKCGDYIQVKGSVEFNGDANGKPGIYMNHSGVKYDRPGEFIRNGGFDGASAGFTESQSAPPVGGGVPGGFAPPPAAAPAPIPTGMPPMVQVPGATMPTATPYQPHTGFTAGPAAAPAPVAPPAAPPAPPAAPVAPVRQMTAAATGPYEAYIAAGWNDDLLRQHGLMV